MAPPDPNAAAAANRLKQAAAEAAVSRIQNGMIVGLGSGSTAALAVAAIGRRVHDEGLQITGIPTSETTAAQARNLGIPLSTLEEHGSIDVTIDGADEVELGTLNLIKGLGGFLLREKLVALASKRVVIMVDDRKLVRRLGHHTGIPVEVASFGWHTTERRIVERTGAHPALRLGSNGQAFVTDGGNYILDCRFEEPIANAAELQAKLDGTSGVVEHGLFLGIAHEVIVEGADGEQILTRGKT